MPEGAASMEQFEGQNIGRVEKLMIWIEPLHRLPLPTRYGIVTMLVTLCFIAHNLVSQFYLYPTLLFLPAVIMVSFVFDRGSGIYASLLSAAMIGSVFVRNADQTIASAVVPIGLFFFISLFSAFTIETLRKAVERLHESSKIRRRIERALYESEQKFRSVFNQQFQFMALLAPDGRLEEINDLPLMVANVSREEVVGKYFWETPWWEGLPEMQRQWPPRLAAAAKAKGPVLSEDEFRMGDGSVHIAEAAITAVKDGGEVEFFIVQASDITPRKEAERARAEANRRKDEFLANMSHELRTPLNAVVGLSNILALSEPLTPRQKQYIHTLKLSSHQLLDIINDLLDVTKIENQSVKLESIPFNLRVVLDEVCSIMDVKAKEKGITLAPHYICLPADHFRGDPLRIRQIFLNLLSNAVKFTDKGSVTVEVNCTKDRADTAQVMIAVVDTGIGIPKDRLKTIFSKFSQADTSITRRFGGTGLGLSITKNLVQMMGGSISVESEVGEGSRFTVLLPLKIEEGKAETGGEGEAPAAAREGRDFHILLVEDHAPNIMVAEALLASYGYSYEIAHEGEEALAKLKEGGFDLVLMDIQMPQMDGLSATRAWRAYEKEHNLVPLPIIGMTAFALAGDRDRCLEAGMDDYLSKPFEPGDFREILERYSAGAGKVHS